MIEVRILGRVLDQIGEQVRERPQRIAGGLLLGRSEGGAFVERALPCPNVGGADDFAIDPQVIVNVRRSLNGGGMVVLGTYRGLPDGAGDFNGRLGTVPTDATAGPFRLDVVAEMEGSNHWTLHLLERSEGATEVPVRVVRPAARRLVTCPE